MKVPCNAHHIIGIEFGMFKRTTSPYAVRRMYEDRRFTIIRNIPYGKLQLQSPGKANFFYSADLLQEDQTIGFDELIQGRRSGGFGGPFIPGRGASITGSVYLPALQQTHGGRMEIDQVSVSRDTTIYGCYTDAIGMAENYDHQYTVQIYLWFCGKENELL